MLAGTRSLNRQLPGIEHFPGADSLRPSYPQIHETAEIAGRPDMAIYLGVIAFERGVDFHPDDTHIYTQIAAAQKAMLARKNLGSDYLEDGRFYPAPFTPQNPPYAEEARLRTLLRVRHNARQSGAIWTPVLGS